MKLLWQQVCVFMCFVFAAVIALECPATITKTHVTTRRTTKNAGYLNSGSSAASRSAGETNFDDEDLDIDLFSSERQKEHMQRGQQCSGQVTTTKTVVANQLVNQDSASNTQLKRRADPSPPTTAGPTADSGSVPSPSSVNTSYTRNCKPPCVFTLAPVPLKETTTLRFTNVTTAYCSVFQGATYKWPFYYTVPEFPVSSVGMAPVHVPETATSGQTLPARPTVAPPPICSIEIPKGTFICPPPNAPISPNGKCGPKVDGPSYCPILECCSANGECGIDQQHCNYTLGCQNEYGLCYIRWDDQIRNQKRAEPEPAPPDVQKIITIPCPHVIGSDLKGLEAAAGIVVGGSLAAAAAWVLKYLGDDALLEACEGTGCGEPGKPENDDDDDEDKSSSTSSSSTSSCSSATLHNVTSYCESYFSTTSRKEGPSTTMATTCPSSTTEITTFCDTASRTRSSTTTTTVWQECTNTTVADMTKYCSTSSVRPTFTTCTDSTTSNRTGCYITATTSSIVANETCVAGANLIDFQDPQGEFGEMIPMMNQTCPYFPDAPVSVNDDQGQDGFLNATCAAPSGPYPTPLPSIDDDQGSDDGGVCPINPIPDQPMDGALEGNLTDSCSVPANSSDSINPFDADQGQDGSDDPFCVAPPANATGIHWSPDADQGDYADDACSYLNATGRISPQDDQGSDTLDAPSCPANRTDYPDPNDDQGQDGNDTTIEYCPMPMYTIYQLPDDDNGTSITTSQSKTYTSHSMPPPSPKLPLIPTITPPPVIVTECPIPINTTAGFGSCVAISNNNDRLTCRCSNTTSPSSFITVAPSTVCGNIVCPNNHDLTITAQGSCTIPRDKNRGPCALIDDKRHSWGTVSPYCECYDPATDAFPTTTSSDLPVTVCGSPVCTNQVKKITQTAAFMDNGPNEEWISWTIYPTGDDCTPVRDPFLTSCTPYSVTYGMETETAMASQINVTTSCQCHSSFRDGYKTVSGAAYELCNRFVCPGEPESMVTDTSRNIYLPQGCTETWDRISSLPPCQIAYHRDAKTDEASCRCGGDWHSWGPVWPKTVCGSLICPNPNGMAGVTT